MLPSKYCSHIVTNVDLLIIVLLVIAFTVAKTLCEMTSGRATDGG